MKVLLVLFLMLAVSPLSMANMDLEWQRIELEKTFDNHYTVALSKLLNRGQYYIKSKIVYSDPGMPRFKDLNKDNVKISSVNFDESKGDYIAFSKVGLEVPVVGKFFKKHQRSLKELYRYKSSFNIFKNIESVSLKVVLDESLSKEKIEATKKVIEANRFDVMDIETQFEYVVQKISTPPPLPAPANEEMGVKEFFELLGKFGNAIGMVLATFLFGFLALYILKKYMELLKELKKMETPKPEDDDSEVKNEESTNKDLEDELLAGVDSINEENLISFERIEKFFTHNRESASLMVKRWLQDNNDDLNLALQGLAQQSSYEKLKDIQELLSSMEGERWQSVIEEFLNDEQLLQANKIIIKEIAKELVSGKKIDDYELVDTLLNLRPQVATKFIVEERENGGVLLNLVSSAFAARILEKIPEADMAQVIKLSIEAVMPESKEEFDQFKKIINEFKSRESLQPFNHKIVQMLPSVTPEKENILYDFLAKNNQRDEMKEAAMSRFPSELILDLPDHVIKYLMQNYPIDQKTHLFLSLSGDVSDMLIEKVAEKGSTARDILDMEMDNIKSDELAIKRIEGSASDIWGKFVQFTRDTLSSTADYDQEVSDTIGTWIKEKTVKAA